MKRISSNRGMSALMLRKAAATMLPFYRKVAANRGFALLWAKAISKANLTQLERLFLSIPPKEKGVSLATNGIGYFFDFSSLGSKDLYSNGTAIRAGKVQFHFHAKVHRAIAQAVLPFYVQLTRNSRFRMSIAWAIRKGDVVKLNRLIRCWIPTPNLVTVAIEDAGFRLAFRFPEDRYVYNHFFYRVLQG